MPVPGSRGPGAAGPRDVVGPQRRDGVFISGHRFVSIVDREVRRSRGRPPERSANACRVGSREKAPGNSSTLRRWAQVLE